MKVHLKFSLLFLYLIGYVSVLNAEVTRIMPLGDSITYDDKHSDYTLSGRSSSIRTGYRSHLYYQLQNANFSVDFVGSRIAGQAIVPPFDSDNEGHPGWTSYEIADSVYQFLSSNPPNTILLHIGSNDNDTSTAGIESILNYIDSYEKNSATNIRVLVALIIDEKGQGSPVYASFNNHLNNLVQKRINDGDMLTLVDMYRGAGLTPDDYDDGTHPNDSGYQKMATVWFNTLMQPYNVNLHSFPRSLVPSGYIASVQVDEVSSEVTFLTQVPDEGIRF
jgi:lysophospholipase L1-like esterase